MPTTAAVDFLSEIYATYRASLEASAAYKALVLEGNRIYLNDVEESDPTKDNTEDGDFPQAILFQGDVSFDEWPQQQYNIARQGDGSGSTVDVSKVVSTEVVLIITHSDLNTLKANKLLLEALAAMRKPGPRMGLAYYLVAPIRVAHSTTAEGVDEAGRMVGPKRRVSQIHLPGSVKLRQSQLTVTTP